MNRYITTADAVHILKQLLYETALNQNDITLSDVFADIAENRIENWIAEIPAADVQEVKHGRWLFTREKTGLPKWTCSVCGGDGRGDYLRCPWCAAKMGKMGDNR